MDAKATGLPVDYHYYGTGDIGGSPAESSVKLLEAMVTKSRTILPSPLERTDLDDEPTPQANGTAVQIGDGPVHVISSKADQMFLDILNSGKEGDCCITRATWSLPITPRVRSPPRPSTRFGTARMSCSLMPPNAPRLPRHGWAALLIRMQRLNEAWALVMGGQFHDIMAGTATPKSYEYSWNDDVIAMNQFAGVLTSASAAIASGMNTQAEGTAVVVYNPLNIEREDVVEATPSFTQGTPQAVRVFGPDGKEVPSQLEGRPSAVPRQSAFRRLRGLRRPARRCARVRISSELKVSESSLENARYRLTIDANGDVSSIYDKSFKRELLAAPARLALQTEHPFDWPGWNMDWADQSKPPRAYVSGPARFGWWKTDRFAWPWK